ncbi:PIN domain-containing protein [Microbacterium sp. KNMS]
MVDTNILMEDPLLRDRKWNAAEAAISAGRLRLVLPELARREAIGGFQRSHDEKIRQVKAVLRKSSSRAKNAADALIQTYETEKAGYESILDARIQAMGIEVAPLPDIDHADLTQRAIDRIPPFNETGGGYRDSLIWLTALEQVEDHPFDDLTILSKDSIFGKKKRVLEEESRRETGASVVVVSSLAAMEFPGEYEPGEFGLSVLDLTVADIVEQIAHALVGLDISRWSPPGPDHAQVEQVGRVDVEADTIKVKKRYGESVYEISADGIADIDATVLLIFDWPGEEPEISQMSARWDLSFRWRGATVGERTRLESSGTLEVFGVDERRQPYR